MSKNTLQIPFLPEVKTNTSLTNISRLLDKQEKHVINFVPWPQFADKPKVQFAIAHDGYAVLLKYDVEEAETLARFTQPNQPVYRDSCVEFFIAFDQNGYYNLEFNSLGTCLGGYGADRDHRGGQPAALLKTIQVLPEKMTSDAAMSAWSLTLVIPVSVFRFDPITSLRGKKCTVNFYKCGDDLKKKQYMAWCNIDWPSPNFHLPQFFGEAEFL